ncbi:dockerin type I repeat-containing protein [Ruminococcus albus]|uniref:Transglutaminase-like superfamily protein n=1 Tax=Ruminococcus albus TaxID=1264 RepID=A0A1I1LMN4_RUMAL|nr:dockerin type I repeat-containing protein [Ruminococcus albus]SFC74374.1 Transglutaminase-like superfamily protein [Ruminococcus albus]
MKMKITALAAAAVMTLATAVSGISAAAAGIPAAEDSNNFLLDCGSRAGYDYLGTMENGEALQAAYDRMCEAAAELWCNTNKTLDKISVYHTYAAIPYDGLDYNTVGIVYLTFRNDFPLYYFTDCMMVGDKTNFYLISDSSYANGSTRAQAQQDIMDYIISVAEKAEDAGSDYEKAKIVHDAINEDLEFAYDTYGEPEREAWAHNVLGACQNGKGVCECYARVYQAVLNYLDIDNYIVSGIAEGGDHAWNAVRLDDGKCYYVDCTWNDMLETDFYFAKGENTMSKDHTVDVPTDDPMRFFIELPDISDTDYDASAIKKSRVKGDVNGDGFINITDITITAANIKGKKLLSEENFKYADMNGDGKVNITDLTKIAAIVKGKAK